MPTRPHAGVTVLTVRRRFDAAAELGGHGLHAVADAQYRHAHGEQFSGGRDLVSRGDGVGTAGEDDAAWGESLDPCHIRVERPDLAINIRLAHSARYQLCVLSAKVEDQDAIGVDVQILAGWNCGVGL